MCRIIEASNTAAAVTLLKKALMWMRSGYAELLSMENDAERRRACLRNAEGLLNGAQELLNEDQSAIDAGAASAVEDISNFINRHHRLVHGQVCLLEALIQWIERGGIASEAERQQRTA